MAALSDIEKLCMNCMNIKPDAAAACPQCGYPAGAYAASSDELAPRTILFGRYLVGRLTARGNVGILYAAYDLKCCQRVTIREYFPKTYAKREYIRPGISRVVPLNEEADVPYQSGLEQSAAKTQQFMAIGALSGLYVPKESFLENGTAYTVLDFVQGVALRKRLENSTYAFADAADQLRPLVASLARLHSAGTSHGELSPGQIFFTSEGMLKMLPPWGVFPLKEGQTELTGANGGNPRSAQHLAVRDARALCAALYTLLSGKEPPPLSGCVREKDIPSLSGMGIPISRQKEHVILKGLCGGYQDARELHWALYGATPTEVGVVRGRDNNATASLEKAVKTISGSGVNKKVQPARQTGRGRIFSAIYASFCLLQLAAGAFFVAKGGGYIVYVLLMGAVVNSLSLWKGFRASPLRRVLYPVFTAGAAGLAGYALFTENGPMEGMLAASFALLLINAVCALIEMIPIRAARK